MNATDFQRWAATSHENYEHNRDAVGVSAGSLIHGYFSSQAVLFARARAADFKHGWRHRFNTDEPEAWA